MKKTFLYYISLFLIYLLGLSTFYSPFRALSFFNEIWAFLTILWIIIVILDSPKFFLGGSNYQILLYIYMVYTIFVPFLTGNNSLGFRFFELGQVPIFILAFNYYKKKNGIKDIVKIVYGYLPFIIITCVLTLRAYSENPLISRIIKESSETGLDFLAAGIGGYHFIYFIVIVFTIMFFLTRENNVKLLKMKTLLRLSFLSLLFFNIVFSNYSTALFLAMLSILLKVVFFHRNPEKLSEYFRVIIILLFGATIFVTPIINYSIELLGNTLNASRLMEIEILFTSDIAGNSIYSRFEAYLRSVDAFIHSPLIGVIFTNLNYKDKGVTGFGQHSQVLDTFALFGVFIGILQLYLFFKPLITIYSNSTNRTFVFTILIVFFLLIFLNNLTPSIGLAVFFIFPAIHDSNFTKKTIT